MYASPVLLVFHFMGASFPPPLASRIEFRMTLSAYQVLDVNLKSVWLLSQAAGRHMIPLRRGKIINFCSLLTFQGGLTVPAYAAAKGALGQVTKALSNEWSQHNVQVNGICPGYINTDMCVHVVFPRRAVRLPPCLPFLLRSARTFKAPRHHYPWSYLGFHRYLAFALHCFYPLQF